MTSLTTTQSCAIGRFRQPATLTVLFPLKIFGSRFEFTRTLKRHSRVRLPKMANRATLRHCRKGMLLSQLTINLGKPPDHDRPIHNIGQ